MLALLMGLAAKAQTLKGAVTDEGGAPLPYATIEVLNQNISTTANVEGRFSITLTPGSYTITCQHIGYQRQQKAVVITTGTNMVDFKLALQQLTLS